MIKYDIIKSGRKTLAIQVKRDGSVVVRSPYGVSDKRIAAFVEEKSDWIARTRNKFLSTANDSLPENKISDEELKILTVQAKEILPQRVEQIAALMNVKYERITIRHQKTRWGSCSGKGNLNFNCMLMLTPPHIRDYVIVHELCHIKELNHSKQFWAEVERVMPDYKERRDWLKKNGRILINRLEKK